MMSDSPNILTGVEGLVKWFDPRKGFGFIVGPEGQDIFVHFTVIDGDGFRVLRDNSKIVYDAERSDKGWRGGGGGGGGGDGGGTGGGVC
jgi:cold shock protein